jgi:photosystem II stability/assembly factor-like uncharacterized protein
MRLDDHCVAIADGFTTNEIDALTSTDGGKKWTVHSLDAQDLDGLSGLSCANPSLCFAVGSEGSMTDPTGVIIETIDGGAVWTQSSIPAGAGPYTGVTCESATRRVAEGLINNNSGTEIGQIIATRNAGKIWKIEPSPTGFVNDDSIACSRELLCVVTGLSTEADRPAVAYSTDGGSAWTFASLYAVTVRSPNGVSCSTGTQCVAVGRRRSLGNRQRSRDVESEGHDRVHRLRSCLLRIHNAMRYDTRRRRRRNDI